MPQTNSDDIVTKVLSSTQENSKEYEAIQKRQLKLISQLHKLIQYVQPERQSQLQKLMQKPQLLLQDLLSKHSKNYEDLIETVCDDLMENVDKQIDLMKSEQAQKQNPERQFQQAAPFQPDFYKNDKPKADNTIKKPQLKWWTQIDNSYFPYIPVIDTKPHSLVPLNQEIVKAQQDKANDPQKYSNFNFGDHKVQDQTHELPNPYSREIEEFDKSIKDKDFSLKIQPQKYDSLEKTPFELIENEEKFQEMKAILMNSEEIAVDLEHHNIRTFLGITCLMQISNRTNDYVVDTIKLRSSIGQLREIFANPKIAKVLHGADMDVEWLQRDFGIYVVNMFDTGQAARVLGLKSFGLAGLLQQYCGVIADKSYQLADWRQRPLPELFVKYAREDTHYLLYIYDCLRKELIEKGIQNNASNPLAPLKQVYHKSSALCLKDYQKPKVKDFQYYMIIGRNKTLQSVNQYSVLKMILKWRDYIARIEDESPFYVIPNHIMFQIAKDMPTTKNELRDSCRSQLPTLILKYQDNLIELIKNKLDKKSKIKKNQHIKFDEAKIETKPKQQQVESQLDEAKIVNKVTYEQEIKLIKDKLPNFKINLIQETATSKIFEEQENKQEPKSVKKLKQKQEVKQKAVYEDLPKTNQLELFKTLTDNNQIKLVEPKSKVNNEVLIDENKLRQLLGKRKDLEKKNIENNEDENPVQAQDFIPTSNINKKFEIQTEENKDENKKSKEKKKNSKEEKVDDLPKSLKEKYGLNKRQKLDSEVTEQKKNSSQKESKKNKVRESSSQVIEEQQPKSTKQQKQTQDQSDLKEKKREEKKDWKEIYNQASQQITPLIEKSSRKSDEQDGKKKKKKGGFKNKGNNKQEQKGKYYLGSAVSDIKHSK